MPLIFCFFVSFWLSIQIRIFVLLCCFVFSKMRMVYKSFVSLSMRKLHSYNLQMPISGQVGFWYLCSFTSIFKTNAKSIEDSENANFFFTTRSYFVQVTAYYEIKIHDIFLYQVLHSASLLFFIRISFITIGQVLTCTSFSSFRAETKKKIEVF